MFRKACIIGVGLIGGSIGMGLKKLNLAKEVVGVSRQHASLVQALKARAVDRVSHDIAKSVQEADLVILSTPVNTIIKQFLEIKDHLKRGCVVTDVGSTKTLIVEAAQKILPPHVFFVGSHPLAGSEKRGAVHGSVDLFKDSICIITPTDKTHRTAVDRIKILWSKLGASVKSMTPAEHDKILGFISHLPHIAAYSLIGSIPQEFLNYATSGLRDTTRIASSDPEMWRDICMTNTKTIIKALDEYVKSLASVRKALVSKNDDALLESFKKSKANRDVIIKA